ncbi:MAG: hypothetical protein V1824_02895, partial [archaeon]
PTYNAPPAVDARNLKDIAGELQALMETTDLRMKPYYKAEIDIKNANDWTIIWHTIREVELTNGTETYIVTSPVSLNFFHIDTISVINNSTLVVEKRSDNVYIAVK